MYELLWFLGGALAYKFLSKLFGITQVVIVFQNLQYSVLTFLVTVTEDVSYIKALKYKTMLESDVDPEQIKKSRIADNEFFENWKAQCINNIQSSVPNYVKLSFDNWEKGMKLLDDHYKNRLSEKNNKK